MSATILSSVPPERSPNGVNATPTVTTLRIAHGEWIKLRSVRSTVMTLVGGAFATVFFSAVFSLSAGSDEAPRGPGSAGTDPVSIALGAITLTQLIVGVAGVLVVTSEYSTGLIRTTFAATGTRLGVLRAKTIVVGIVVATLMAVATAVAVIAGQALYGGDEPKVALSDPALWRVVLGATTYVAGVAVIGIALGFVARSTAGAVGAIVAGLFIGPNLLSFLPDGIADGVVRLLPSSAGESMMAIAPGSDLLSSGWAFAVLGLWVTAAHVFAAIQLVRRDA